MRELNFEKEEEEERRRRKKEKEVYRVASGNEATNKY